MIKTFQLIGCYLVARAVVTFVLGDIKLPIKKEDSHE